MINKINFNSQKHVFKAVGITQNSLENVNPTLYKDIFHAQHHYSNELGLFTVNRVVITTDNPDEEGKTKQNAFLLRSLTGNIQYKKFIEMGLLAGLKTQGIQCYYMENEQSLDKIIKEKN